MTGLPAPQLAPPAAALLFWDKVENHEDGMIVKMAVTLKWAGLQCGTRLSRLSAIFCRQKIRRQQAAAVFPQVMCVGLRGSEGSTFNQSDTRPWSRTVPLFYAFFCFIKCKFKI